MGGSRSKSMPSICIETFSSLDSTNSSLENQIDSDAVAQEAKPNRQESIDKTRKVSKTNSTGFFQDTRPKRYGSIDLLDTKTDYNGMLSMPTTISDHAVQQRQKEGRIFSIIYFQQSKTELTLRRKYLEIKSTIVI